jgi:signal transduction histidine kinase
MSRSAWSTQQLAEFLSVVSSAKSERFAALAAVERAAEALDAEVAAIVSGGGLMAVVGYPEGSAPVAELSSVTPGAAGLKLSVPGAGDCPATAVSLEHPLGATLVVARSNLGGLAPDEASLLSGMARVTSMTLRTLCLLDDERAARQESDRQAAENARLLGILTERQAQLERLAEEQAALRRVATLVAGHAVAEEIFAAVAEEAGGLLRAASGSTCRYERDGTMTIVSGWKGRGTHIPVGTRMALEGESLAATVLRSGGPAQIDYDEASGPIAERVRRLGVRSSIGAPIVVNGRIWGALMVSSNAPAAFPAGSEQRLAGFTELVATAISNAQAREDLNQLAEEQAALRRVATLVARGAPPAEVFASVTEEVGRLLGVEITSMARFESPDTVTLVAGAGAGTDEARQGSRWKLEPLALASVARTGHPARVDDDDRTLGVLTTAARREGIRSAVATPIVGEGRRWGGMYVASRSDPLPADTEQRTTDFTELVATAIANAESRSQLTASRARIVAASDATRRRIERDLHDGIQQRLVTLGLQLETVSEAAKPERSDLLAPLSQVKGGLRDVLDELREISRGVHPAILSEGGLGPALKSLARRCTVRVQLQVGPVTRLPPSVEAAAYYVASEALTNAAKHANASVARVTLELNDGIARLSIRDDGVGGADPSRGSGIIGLTDRVEALGGTITLSSPPGAGTSIVVQLPTELGGARLQR